jgi:hypothetical protein
MLIAAAYIDVSPKTLAVVQQCGAARSGASKVGKTSKPGAEGLHRRSESS